jgi:hypothetical protein
VNRGQVNPKGMRRGNLNEVGGNESQGSGSKGIESRCIQGNRGKSVGSKSEIGSRMSDSKENEMILRGEIEVIPRERSR